MEHCGESLVPRSSGHPQQSVQPGAGSVQVSQCLPDCRSCYVFQLNLTVIVCQHFMGLFMC